MLVLVGSSNPVKIEATSEAFSRYFQDVEVKGIPVDSGVPAQPLGEETFIGAENRAKRLLELARKESLDADFFVGIEGGISRAYGKWLAFGAVCVMDKSGRLAFGASPHFELPDRVMKEILAGKELGLVMEEITGIKDVKKKEGAVGVFTKGEVSRKDLYVSGVIMALIPFLNEEIYFD